MPEPLTQPVRTSKILHPLLRWRPFAGDPDPDPESKWDGRTPPLGPSLSNQVPDCDPDRIPSPSAAAEPMRTIHGFEDSPGTNPDHGCQAYFRSIAELGVSALAGASQPPSCGPAYSQQ